MNNDEWVAAMPEDFRSLFGGIHFTSVLRELRNREFQMQGRYDGAMSEDCKALCRKNQQLIEMLLAAVSCR